MLIIKHVTGGLAGTEKSIDPASDRVVFGRQTDCDVIFPPEETLVSRHHFALVRKASGDWTIDLFGKPFVAIDGIPAEAGQRVADGARVELGRLGGPSFHIGIEAELHNDGLLLTAQQEEVEGSRVVAQKASAAASRARLLAGAGILVAAIAVGIGGYVYFFGRSAAAKFDEAMARFADDQAKVATAGIGSQVRDHLISAVYHVVKVDANGRREAVGTAWPVAPHLLATNAHVAIEGEDLKPGQVLAVQSPGKDGKLINVVSRKVHPGYAAFTGFLQQDPVVVQEFGGQAVRADLSIPGYDVALLEIKEDLPPASIFQVASDDEIKALNAGTPVATAGYPTEEIAGSDAQLIGATPELHLGTITGLTDFFFLPSDDAHRQLIHDDLPSAGGASGSPIVNAKGHVVALLSAGNSFIMPKIEGLPVRIPNAAQINYGQRVDLLKPLLDDTLAKAVEADRAYWTQQIAYFSRGIDVIIPSILDKAKPTPTSVSAPVNDQKLQLGNDTKKAKASGGTQRQIAVTIPVTPGASYVFVAYGHEEAHLELYLMVGDQIAQKSTESKWFPSISFTAKTETQVTLWVVSPEDRDVAASLRAYKWDTKTPA
jgi:hypothetical protein